MWILVGDRYFNSDLLAVIQPVDDGDQTVIFTAGQSAIDGGFLIDVPTDEVFEMVQNARLHELAQMMVDSDQSEEPGIPRTNENDVGEHAPLPEPNLTG